MLVDILVNDPSLEPGQPGAPPLTADFEDTPMVGDFVYLPTRRGEVMFRVVARFHRRTEKPAVTGPGPLAANRIVHRRHTLFIGVELPEEVALPPADRQ
jgi:hypothetical protein